MKNTLSISDSLVGSLCREVEYLRKRYCSIMLSLENCTDNFLEERLKNEVINLVERKEELSKVCQNIVNRSNKNDLSMLFLAEVCNRPLKLAL